MGTVWSSRFVDVPPISCVPWNNFHHQDRFLAESSNSTECADFIEEPPPLRFKSKTSLGPPSSNGSVQVPSPSSPVRSSNANWVPTKVQSVQRSSKRIATLILSQNNKRHHCTKKGMEENAKKCRHKNQNNEARGKGYWNPPFGQSDFENICTYLDDEEWYHGELATTQSWNV
ncbi:hypothetical protein O181_037954 [Austropuccinia psidii MF-1]|uniref:Uncharacterized protein n=1 Tax=Austropuccinia psidii MF-1 TaxID=1389203 RepID=A0A9Q3D7J2_9BASI|nr:hypothetical protein [Austropuccinia psidii MF-1]